MFLELNSVFWLSGWKLKPTNSDVKMFHTSSYWWNTFVRQYEHRKREILKEIEAIGCIMILLSQLKFVQVFLILHYLFRGGREQDKRMTSEWIKEAIIKRIEHRGRRRDEKCIRGRQTFVFGWANTDSRIYSRNMTQADPPSHREGLPASQSTVTH